VFVLALGLERTGLVDHLAALYDHSPAPLATIGAVSSVGSALLNNHPMSVLNAFALDRMHGAGAPHAFAALIGGDLGPRLLPVGSLASLLWFDVLHRHGVHVTVRTFVRIGVAITLPALAISLAVLWMMS
jgi:arsenical pump membrane protein